MAIITFQPEFRPALPCVFGAKDYREFRAVLEEMDRILASTGIEHRFILERMEELDPDLSAKRFARHYRHLPWCFYLMVL